MARIALVLPLILLTACQGGVMKNEESPFYDVPAGSELILNETIKIPAGRTSVYLQGGKVLPYSQIDPYNPHCQFDIRTKKDVPQTINKDKFVIYKIGHRIGGLKRQIKVAGLRVFSGGNGNGGPSHETFATILYLRSENQPDILTMTCQHWADPTDAEYLTIKQMRKAMGSVFVLKLVTKGARAASESSE